ncbi:hypothetical protein J2X76_003665 [Neorhizobium sp. 2083]|uniref:hypothetical protein n=1 Tax=Neorhizobium sp. 2083 TaxID=2817762 RepID=UPI0028646116|nr:hypothetical protein [Neorhizobium sp. 2083]MDR6818488.1 hypothetical protein [Neorhizobium sp. 2083]
MITGREIGERFIRAVQIMEGLYRVGPSGGSGSWIAVPYTQADKNGWGSERLAAERQAFWNSINNAPRPWEITEAEETLTWLRFVEDENERLCLTAWARCMAMEHIFKDWCKTQSIHPETGRRRKERAILRILLAFDRKPLQNNEIDVNDLLPDHPISGHKSVNIAEDAPGKRYWRPSESKPICGFDESLRDFSWAEAQAERRRQREKRKQAA